MKRNTFWVHAIMIFFLGCSGPQAQEDPRFVEIRAVQEWLSSKTKAALVEAFRSDDETLKQDIHRAFQGVISLLGLQCDPIQHLRICLRKRQALTALSPKIFEQILESAEHRLFWHKIRELHDKQAGSRFLKSIRNIIFTLNPEDIPAIKHLLSSFAETNLFLRRLQVLQLLDQSVDRTIPGVSRYIASRLGKLRQRYPTEAFFFAKTTHPGLAKIKNRTRDLVILIAQHNSHFFEEYFLATFGGSLLVINNTIRLLGGEDNVRTVKPVFFHLDNVKNLLNCFSFLSENFIVKIYFSYSNGDTDRIIKWMNRLQKVYKNYDQDDLREGSFFSFVEYFFEKFRERCSDHNDLPSCFESPRFFTQFKHALRNTIRLKTISQTKASYQETYELLSEHGYAKTKLILQIEVELGANRNEVLRAAKEENFSYRKIKYFLLQEREKRKIDNETFFLLHQNSLREKSMSIMNGHGQLEYVHEQGIDQTVNVDQTQTLPSPPIIQTAPIRRW